ncbi:MAG TPA: hypothetical protein PK055_05975 [Gammaproteobacteria bacterium]|nr:hypothetical protein [Xanthomonadales bacterium]MCB1593650.1 hypothetical protein [Xanthomonadales bacterium]HPI95387.1 hypothetical protein [Gammaproteobacteria bacterium]HPQ87183.1 hypothetical protein [Gammaproteobacteria bacterium]
MKNVNFFLLVLSFNSFASGFSPLWVFNPDMPDTRMVLSKFIPIDGALLLKCYSDKIIRI